MANDPNIVQGRWVPGGVDVNGDGNADVTFRQIDSARRQHTEVRQLNQYTGYFSTPEGDFPVSCVANSIRDAARILSLPGVFGQDVSEPTMIKFNKGNIAVSAPVHVVGFNTFITPSAAIDSGAYATPAHAEVQNGSDVIFTAFEPFGWKFVGWYKGDPDNGGTLISTDKVSTIDVYDAYSSLVQYYAKYEFEAKIRNGRYMDIESGKIWTFSFDRVSDDVLGTLVIATEPVRHKFILSSLTEDSFHAITDQRGNLIQPDTLDMLASFEATAIGINVTINNITSGNSLGIMNNSKYTLKWIDG